MAERLSQRDYADLEKSAPRREPMERKYEVVGRLAGKVTKDEVYYRDCNELEDKKCCAECVHYLIPGASTSSCRRVAGVVYATDTCDLWAERPEEFGGQGGNAQPQGE